MKVKYGLVLFLGWMCISPLTAQRDYRADSLQFKMYTRLYVNPELQVDSIVVKKVFCDFCSDKQLQALRKEAYRRTEYEQNNPKYKSAGEHRLALYIRLSKEDFKAIDNRNDE